MEIITCTAPFDAEEMLSWLEKIFGVGERLLETPQLNGEEIAYNRDIVLLAKENGKLLGAIHGTIPHHEPHLAGLSAMFTTPEARGTGLGRKLFGKLVETLENEGVTAMVLGTSNPIGEKLYASFGFRYLYGSGVMARFAAGSVADFNRARFDTPKGEIHIEEGSPKMRIPIVPLTLSRLKYKVYDINLGLINPELKTQPSCMGLFPKCLSLQENGGRFYGAYDEAGVLGAVATVTADGCFDGFAYPAWESALEEMFRKGSATHMLIADGDEEKSALAARLGLRIADAAIHHIPSHYYR